MRILAFDTATAATTVALVDDQAELELEERDDPPPGQRPRHATALLPLLADVLHRAGGGWEAVERIAVGTGPGTFTGLRIGVATARALGRSRGIPLIGVSTLESLALGVRSLPLGEQAAGSPDAVLAVLDARRGEAFAAAWGLGGEHQQLERQLLGPRALAPSALAALLPELGAHPLAIGSGAVEFRSQLERSGAWVPTDASELHRVSALNHCLLAAPPRAADGAGEIHPDYLRLPDAELARRRRATARDPRADHRE